MQSSSAGGMASSHCSPVTNHEFLLSRALTVAPRLVGIHTAHAFEDALRVGLFHVRRLGSVAVSPFALPRSRAGWSLRPFRHGGRYDVAVWIARLANPWRRISRKR